MDQNNPARFLDTAYNALKANPGATNQILQAAAQGAPVGLRGLAAAAAQQSQQEAQKTMTALQQQGPQPNIVQKLATQGIMSQMDTGLPIAPQMGAPEQMPQQMMAGGGLVSFAGGGNVLPPDVIDAIQSHFAEGGDVRGYAGGEDIELSDFERRHPEVLRDTVGSRWSDVLTSHAQTDKDVLGDIADRWKATLGHHAQMDKDVLGPIVDRWKAMHASHMQNDADLARGFKQTWEESTAPIGGAIDRTPRMSMSDYQALEEKGAFGPKPPGILDKISGYIQSQTPKTAIPVGGETSAEPTETDIASLDRLIENYPRNGILAARPTETPSKTETLKDDRGNKIPTPSVRKPDATLASQESTVKPDLIEEGKKVDKIFDQATGAKEEGLGAIAPGADMETLRNQIMELRGRKEMSPEIAAKLEDLQSGARTSTILQSLLGGLAGGLSNPYGGRFALGQAAAGALGGYQKGVGSEEEMNRQAFNILRGYADAPAEEQAKAADELFAIQSKAAERQSAERIADLKGTDALERLLLSEQGKYARYGQGRPTTEAQLAQIQNLAVDNARKTIDSENKKRESAFKPPLTTAEEQAIIRDEFLKQQAYIQSGGANIGLGGNISAAQAGGLGGGAPRIYTRSQ